MVGEKYNYLTIIEETRNEKSQIICKCQCVCGNYSNVPYYKLKTNRIKSCGCKKNELISKGVSKHNGRNTLLYSKWSGIKRRCYNKNDSHYKEYGGRGITMCKEWRNDFAKFRTWAIKNGYKKGLSIERIDINKGYEPSNCKWIKLEKQAENKRNAVYMIYNNKRMRMVEVAKLENMPVKTLSSRYYRFLKRNKDIDKKTITFEMIIPTDIFKGNL